MKHRVKVSLLSVILVAGSVALGGCQKKVTDEMTTETSSILTEEPVTGLSEGDSPAKISSETSKYKYLYDADFLTDFGDIITITVPWKDSDIKRENPIYYCYKDYYDDYYHGISIYLRVRSNENMNCEEYLNMSIDKELEDYLKRPRDYLNYVELESSAEQNKAYYVNQIDRIGDDLTQATRTQIYQISEVNQQEILYLELNIFHEHIDSDTEPLLREILAAYDIPFDNIRLEIPNVVSNNKPVKDRTRRFESVFLGNEHWNPDIITYLEPLKEYPLLGIAKLERDGYESEVFVPYSEITAQQDSFALFDLHGLRGDVYLYENDAGQSGLEYIMKRMAYVRDSHQEAPKYYQDISEIRSIPGVNDRIDTVLFSEYEVEADNSRWQVYQIMFSERLEDNYYRFTELEIDTADISTETAELLRQYGEVLNIDFYELLGWNEDDPISRL